MIQARFPQSPPEWRNPGTQLRGFQASDDVILEGSIPGVYKCRFVTQPLIGQFRVFFQSYNVMPHTIGWFWSCAYYLHFHSPLGGNFRQLDLGHRGRQDVTYRSCRWSRMVRWSMAWRFNCILLIFRFLIYQILQDCILQKEARMCFTNVFVIYRE